MVTLNLTYPNLGNIDFLKTKYPDGQQDIKINLKNQMTPKSVMIKSRLTNFKDLELIICATKALRNMGIKEIYLYIPYLLGSRSDRLFEYGGTSYLRDVLAPILNAQNYEKVITLDVHSDVAEACINNLSVRNNHTFVHSFIQDLFNDGKEFTLVSPDLGEGAYYHMESYMGLEFNLDIWLCDVTKFVFGEFPKNIYFVKL